MVTLSEVKERKLLVAVCFLVRVSLSLSPSLSTMPLCITNSMHFLRPRFGSVDPSGRAGRGQSVRPSRRSIWMRIGVEIAPLRPNVSALHMASLVTFTPSGSLHGRRPAEGEEVARNTVKLKSFSRKFCRHLIRRLP